MDQKPLKERENDTAGEQARVAPWKAQGKQRRDTTVPREDMGTPRSPERTWVQVKSWALTRVAARKLWHTKHGEEQGNMKMHRKRMKEQNRNCMEM